MENSSKTAFAGDSVTDMGTGTTARKSLKTAAVTSSVRFDAALSWMEL